MCKESDKNKDKKTFSDWLIIVMYIIIALAVLCCIIGFFWHPFEYPNEDGLVITFLGALAAFVVISNYAQISELKQKTEKYKLFVDNFRLIGDHYIKVRIVEILNKRDSKIKVDIKNIKHYVFIKNGKVYVKINEIKKTIRPDGNYDVQNELEENHYIIDLITQDITRKD